MAMFQHTSIPPGRGIFCNRTLNLRSIRAIGYDMDYTLIHYDVEEWERCAYQFIKEKLLQDDWPVANLEFDPGFVIRGLIIDKELGNIVKANRFGYIKRALHGTRLLAYDEQREAYSRTVVDLSESRWVFLNTFFSLSEACMYAQLVDALDDGQIPEVLGYSDLYAYVRTSLDEAHMEGELKARIIAEPDRFVVLDPDAPKALLDQRDAGKKLMLITNSEWGYTREMMEYAYDRFLPDGMTWRDLFEVVVVSARKPFFFFSNPPAFEIVDEEGLLRPVNKLHSEHKIYLGGSSEQVEDLLGISGSDILYVGDHIYSDVHVSKGVRRWRTAVIIRELEDELLALESFGDVQGKLDDLMSQKIAMEYDYSQMRLRLQRIKTGRAPGTDQEADEIQQSMNALRNELIALDNTIAPLAQGSGKLDNERWGLLMRTGNDKSHLARQIERHADVYTSRVSNFLFETPFVYIRSSRGSLPHDPIRITDPDAGEAE